MPTHSTYSSSVDVATGAVLSYGFDFYLNGVIPFEIERLWFSDSDFSGYPDCRDAFVKSMNTTLNLAMDYPFNIRTPLMFLTKKETWALADRLGAFDYIRRHTHTCYQGTEGGCHECPSCILRERGLREYLAERGAD